MAELDLSMHSLNTSISKYKYSFPKSNRFADDSKKYCDSFYEIPSMFSSRTTSLGYGNKDMGGKKSFITPPVGRYDISNDLKGHGISFGVGREKMELGGPLKDAKLLSYVPGPGNYKSSSMLDSRAPSLRSRLPDRSLEQLAKVPAPGTYNHEKMGNKDYYLLSKHRNFTNLNISKVSRPQSLPKQLSPIGPSDYKNAETLTPKGKYNLSQHVNALGGAIGKGERAGIIEKAQLGGPGPGQYTTSWSSFGTR